MYAIINNSSALKNEQEQAVTLSLKKNLFFCLVSITQIVKEQEQLVH